MRTMFVCNSLASTYPTTKGALAVKMPDGSFSDLTSGVDNIDKNAVIDFLNSMGNGSVRTFTLNPFDFEYRFEATGSAASVTPKYNITYPTGNARVDSMTNQFTGGIVIKRKDANNNIFKSEKILNVEVIGANAGYVTVAEVLAAFKTAMASITGSGNIIASDSHTGSTSSIFNLTSDDSYIDLVGDLRHWKLVRTNGVDLSISGVEVAKLERELAPNMGYHFDGQEENDLFAASNFIVDPTAVYNVITLTTRTSSQRPLLPNSAGFNKVLHLFFLHDERTVTALYNTCKEWLLSLFNDPTGYNVIE